MTNQALHSSQDDASVLPFVNLPNQVIDRILRFVDPETFSSLLVLNRRWRQRADTAQLYATQLFRTLPASKQRVSPPIRSNEKDLPKYRRKFAQQVQHHFWAPYRPRRHSFQLSLPFVPSATANPLGESIDYTFSPQATWLLATTSNRIYILSLNVSIPELRRACKIKRRPLAVAISDDGDTLALLTQQDHVNIYRLSNGSTRPTHSIALASHTTCIALSPDCSMLVAGSSSGIEIVSLTTIVADPGTNKQVPLKRTIGCPRVDIVSFDELGAAVLATSLASGSTTVVFPPPDEDLDVHAKWHTQALHSKSFQKCTHASLLKSNSGASMPSRAVAFDVPAGAFGVLDLQDLRFLDSAWSSPSSLAQTRPNTITMPAASHDNRLVAVGIKRQGISLYRLRGIKSKSRPIVMPHTREIRLSENLQGLRWVTKLSSIGQPSNVQSTHCLVIASSNTTVPSRPFVDALDFDDDAPETTGMLDYLTFGYHVSVEDKPNVPVPLETDSLDTLDDPYGVEFTPFPISEMDASESRIHSSVHELTSAPREGHAPHLTISTPVSVARVDSLQQGDFVTDPVSPISDDLSRRGTVKKGSERMSMPDITPDTIPNFTAASSINGDVDNSPPRRTMSMRRVFSDSYEHFMASSQRPRSADVSKRLESFGSRSSRPQVLVSTIQPAADSAEASEPSRQLRRRRTSTSAIQRLSTAFDDLSSSTRQWTNGPSSTQRPQLVQLSQSLPSAFLPEQQITGPSGPTADQMASLSRRYTQHVPVPRVNTSVPRAAAGAHRRSSGGYDPNLPYGNRMSGYASQLSLAHSIPEGDEDADVGHPTSVRGRGTQRNSLIAPDGIPRLNTIHSVGTLGKHSGSRSKDRSDSASAHLNGVGEGTSEPDPVPQASSGQQEDDASTPAPTRRVQGGDKSKRRSRIFNPQSWASEKPLKVSRSKTDRKCIMM